MSDWLSDSREIKALVLGDERYEWAVGDRFERIERNGEYCMIPWVRIETHRRNNVQTTSKRTVEAPLNHLEWIEFGEPA